ncbi:MAG: hypothetical protein KF684_14015 [Phycisphaeraceae bacterium]|nr:hypothetical protein [Phycisphaeraceae bacterium]
MILRLGELMVRRGLLSERQVERVLEVQTSTGRPFGELAEEMYDLHPQDVERVWAEQYAAGATRIDPRTEPVEQAAISLVSRRQAWQFSLLPLRIEGRELVVCTTQDNLPRALRFVYRRLERPASFMLCDQNALAEALQKHYPMTGQSAESWSSPFIPAA